MAKSLVIKTATELETVQRALQLKYQQSLYHTAKYLCGYQDINWVTHGKALTVLQSPRNRKLVVMPRGTFKTSLCVVAFTIWNIIRNPNVRILIDSELWTLSRNSLREIKAHITGGAFQSVFPGWGLTLANQDEMTVNQRTTIRKEPTVTASGIGAGKTGQHYDIILFDDLNSPQNSLKPELAQKVVDHYRYYTSILEPGGVISGSGTRYAEMDLIGHILRTEVEGVAE
jgi:hypothetical protein